MPWGADPLPIQETYTPHPTCAHSDTGASNLSFGYLAAYKILLLGSIYKPIGSEYLLSIGGLLPNGSNQLAANLVIQCSVPEPFPNNQCISIVVHQHWDDFCVLRVTEVLSKTIAWILGANRRPEDTATHMWATIRRSETSGRRPRSPASSIGHRCSKPKRTDERRVEVIPN